MVVRRAALTFENAKELSILSKKSNRLMSAAFVKSLGEIVEATINHLNGDVSKGSVESVSDIVSEVNKDSVKNPSAPKLEQNAIDGASPKVGKTKKTFDNMESIFNPPTLPIKGSEVMRRQNKRVTLIGEVRVVLAPIVDRNQTEKLTLRS